MAKLPKNALLTWVVFIKMQFVDKLFFKTLDNHLKRVYHITKYSMLRNDEYPKLIESIYFVKKEVYHG